MGVLQKDRIILKDKIYLSKSKKKNGKDGYWQIYYPNPNNPEKRTKMSTGTKKLSEASQILARFKEEYKQAKENNIKSISIPEFADVFYNYKSNYITEARAYNYKYELTRLDKFLEGKVKLDQLTQKNIEDYISYLYSKQYRVGTIKENISKISTGLKYAKEHNYLNENAKISIPSIKAPKVNKGFLTEDMLQKLLTNCKNQDLKDIMIVAYMTGMRRGEIINLQWRQVDLEKRTFILDNKTHLTKSRNTRVVPLNDDVVPIIEERLSRQVTEYVFTYKFKKWTIASLRYYFDTLVEKTFGENSGITFHTLRHSFGSNLVNKGTNHIVIKNLMGHNDIQSTLIYAHVASDTMHEAVQLLSLKNVKKIDSNNN